MLPTHRSISSVKENNIYFTLNILWEITRILYIFGLLNFP